MILQRKADNNEKSLIDILWYVDEKHLDKNRQIDTIIPTEHVHIIYNFSEPYYLLNGESEQVIPNIVLAGPTKSVRKVFYGKTVKMLGIAMHPMIFYGLFHEVSSLYNEVMIDCNNIESMQFLHDQVKAIVKAHGNDGDAILNAIEGIFEDFDYTRESVEQIDEMIHYIEKNNGLVDMQLMADYFAYSLSALERKFKKHMGLTPKVFADMMRFRRAVLEDDPECLFYDQSHYIKNCRKYTNKIPSDLLKSKEISLLHMLELVKK